MRELADPSMEAPETGVKARSALAEAAPALRSRHAATGQRRSGPVGEQSRRAGCPATRRAIEWRLHAMVFRDIFGHRNTR